MPSRKYNPERRTWRGQSYKKGGEPVAELRREDCKWWNDEIACLGKCRCEECPECGIMHPPFGVDCDRNEPHIEDFGDR